MVESVPQKKWISKWGVILILAGQILIFSLRLTDPFIDGRFHTNWGPPFWLMHAQEMHKTNFFRAYLGVVSETEQMPNGTTRATSWYSSHPQLIAIPLYIWTGIFGYAEWVVRSLAAVLTLSTTIIFWFAFRIRHSTKQTMLFLLFWAASPIMINFGSKLDQEPVVLLSLALAFLGHELFLAGRVKNPWLWCTAIALLIWSDWSGFIFGALIFLAVLYTSRVHKPSRKLMLTSVLGGVIGTGIVGLQTIGESYKHGVVASNFIGLYKYRSNSSQPHFWYAWLRRYTDLFWFNYGASIAYVAFGSYFIYLKQALYSKIKIPSLLEKGLTLGLLCGIIGIGTLVYALIVPQATAIHLYYQYFYALPFAYGLMYGALFFEQYLIRHSREVMILWVVVVLVCVWLVNNGIENLNKDITTGWGTSDEIELLKKIKKIDADKKVYFIGRKDFSEWLDNPNIQYYAGRSIPLKENPAEALDADWILFGKQSQKITTESVEMLNKVIDKQFQFHIVNCSRLLCLVQKTKK